MRDMLAEQLAGQAQNTNDEAEKDNKMVNAMLTKARLDSEAEQKKKLDYMMRLRSINRERESQAMSLKQQEENQKK